MVSDYGLQIQNVIIPQEKYVRPVLYNCQTWALKSETTANLQVGQRAMEGTKCSSENKIPEMAIGRTLSKKVVQ